MTDNIIRWKCSFLCKIDFGLASNIFRGGRKKSFEPDVSDVYSQTRKEMPLLLILFFFKLEFNQTCCFGVRDLEEKFLYFQNKLFLFVCLCLCPC